MKHIILICHKAHLVSGSVNFIKDLFEQKFTVDMVSGDLSLKHVKALLKLDSDNIFVLWQTEYLGPWLTSLGHKVVVFPMYDGCGNAPKSYFKILDKTYLFSFSKKLHEKCVDTGIVSYQLMWYPSQNKIKSSITKDDTLFYWQRRPKGILAASNIIELFSPYVNKIHLHDRPDGYELDKFPSLMSNHFIITSSWFKNKNDLLSLVSRSKYFIAPRESEGIGMAFLEAMSKGCIVFANRESTHDQYIYDGYNGFLIDFGSGNKKLIQKQIKKAFRIINSGKPIGENAREFMKNGELIWEEQSRKILNVLKTIDESPSVTATKKSEQKIGYFLARIYYIHPWLYFLLSDMAIRMGYFSDLSVVSAVKGFVYAILGKAIIFLKGIIRRLKKK